MTQHGQPQQMKLLETYVKDFVLQHVADTWENFATQSKAVRQQYGRRLNSHYYNEAKTVRVRTLTKEKMNYQALEYNVQAHVRLDSTTGYAIDVMSVLSLMEAAVDTGDRVWYDQLSTELDALIHACYQALSLGSGTDTLLYDEYLVECLGRGEHEGDVYHPAHGSGAVFTEMVPEPKPPRRTSSKSKRIKRTDDDK